MDPVANERIAGDRRIGMSERRLTWLTFGVLILGALVGILSLFPYLFQIAGPQFASTKAPLWIVLVAQVAQSLILVAIAVAIGLWLGPRVGLGAPLLRSWLAGDPDAPARFRASLPLSIGLGVLASIAIVALDVFVFAPLIQSTVIPALGRREIPWQGLLASLYGGFVEELLLRFGVMTLFVWIGAKVTGTKTPGPVVMWTANVVAALLFGAGHLPATALLVPLTPLVVARALILNGLVGVVFGWLYWRRGILSAMTSHFSGDIILHVLTPLFM
jgi:Type II CAAX prenyl endopeptidase Rce1-like